MPSSYSTNLKIELQATGENSGTWGTITNTNLGTALEQAIVGYGNPSYASDANLTLTYTDTNAAQAARALVLNVTSAVSLTGTRELVVPTIQKQYIVQNNTTGSQSITVKTSAGTGITVPNGRKAHLYVNGTDVIFMDDFVDINGGAIDGTTIGANSAAAGTFTTVGATTGNITTVNATTVDTTNIEVTNLKAKDGTAAGSIADSTGVVTLASTVLTTTDINGGTIDGTTIGGSSAAAGTFTTLTTSSTVTLNGGTANGVLYLNGSKVATSGSALVFDGTNLGIGTSSPAFKLDVAGGGGRIIPSGGSSNTPNASVGTLNVYSASSSIDTRTGTIRLESYSNQAINIGSSIAFSGRYIDSSDAAWAFAKIGGYKVDSTSGNAGGYLALATSTTGGDLTERLRIDNVGNVGIGTSSPGQKLDVQGSATDFVAFNGLNTNNNAGTITSSAIKFGFTSTVGTHYATLKITEDSVNSNSGGLTISLPNGGVESPLLTLTSAGNLGIGTTSPGYKLQVNGASSGLVANIGYNGDTGTGLYVGVDHANSLVQLYASGSTSKSMVFYTGNTEVMRYNNSGNLGIGTSSPGVKLSVVGAGSFTGTGFSGAAAPTVSFANTTATTGRTFGINSADAGFFQIYDATASNATRMIIDSSGNLGLGVTPSAWTSDNKALQVGAYAGIESSPGGGGGIGLFGNAYEYTTNAYKYLQDYYATLYRTYAGQHQWFTAPSGTAGNTITFTQTMVLDSNGNLGVGSTAPTNSGGYKTLSLSGSTGGQITFQQSNADKAFIYHDATNFNIYNSVNGPLVFWTNSAERARITSGGSLLVGSTTDSGYHRFNRSNTSDWICAFANTSATTPWGITLNYSAAAPNNTSAAFTFADNAAERATIRNNGGLANYQANDVNLSDQRVKKDVKPLGSMWDKFKAIEIVTFKYKDQTHDDDNIGVIAQQVEAVAPEFIDVDGFGETPEDGVPLKTVYTTDMYHAAIKALQEAMARIESLEAKVAALEAK